MNKISNKAIALGLLAGAFVLPGIFAGDCTVNTSTLKQKITGYGACTAWSSETDVSAKGELLFDTIKGIGLSMVRSRIPPKPGEYAATFPPMKVALKYGVTQFWACPWSPPAAMKSNNDVNNGGTLKAASYSEYATQLASYCTQAKTALGMDLMCLSVQNESDYKTSYESCEFSGTQNKDFVKVLGPALKTAGLSTKIMIAETMNGSAQNIASKCDESLNDATASSFISVIGTHLYAGGPAAYPLAASKGKEYWETEISNMQGPWDTSMKNGLQTANWIHGCMVTASMNAFHYWWIVRDVTNEGLIGQNNATPKRFWIFGNYSKFVRPGFNRVDATANPTSGVSVSAYISPNSGKLVIVAINSGNSAVSQKFTISGFTTASVIPNVTATASTDNLTAKTAVPVTSNSFTYSLEGPSVTTFVGLSNAPVSIQTANASGIHKPDLLLNAASGKAISVTSTNNITADIVISNIAGQVVYRGKDLNLKQGTNNLHTGKTSLPAGVYTWKINSKETAEKGSLLISSAQ